MTTRVHLATGSYFRSRNKDGGHAFRSAEAENLMPHAHFTALCVCYRRRVIGDGIFKPLQGSGFVLTRTFPLLEYWMVVDLFVPVTLTLTR